MKLPFAIVYATLSATALIAGCSAGTSTTNQVLPTLAVLPVAPPVETVPIATSLAMTVFAMRTQHAPVTSTLVPPPTDIAIAECSEESWWTEAMPLVTEFLDTAEIATNTSRMALPSVILELQRTWRTFERIDAPNCGNVRQIASTLSFGMEMAIQAFNDFLGDTGLQNAFFELASLQFYEAYELSPLRFGLEVRPRIAFTIWGGAEPNHATSTALIRRLNATLTAVMLPGSTPTQTSQSIEPVALPQQVRCASNEMTNAIAWFNLTSSLIDDFAHFQNIGQLDAVRAQIMALGYPACAARMHAVALNALASGHNAFIALTGSERDAYIADFVNQRSQFVHEFIIATGTN